MSRKRTRLQKKDEAIKMRNSVIKLLVTIISNNKIGIPMQLFNMIKDMFGIDIALDQEQTDELNKENKEKEDIKVEDGKEN